ncbi:MAG: rod shape-determining protein MreD [Proteobacteria bacterium]|nr:rod shape-determining protein MreD [Pseudomonadota bacterium]
MMQPTLLQSLDLSARKALPAALTLMLMLFALTPTNVPGLSPVMPMFALMSIYFWAIYRPELMGYGAAFSFGLLEDLLTATPIGSSALVFLLTQWIVLRQQKFFNAKPFVVTWFAFIFVAAGAALIRWIAVGLIADSGFTPVGPMFASYLITVAVYPLVGWLLAKAQVKLMGQV